MKPILLVFLPEVVVRVGAVQVGPGRDGDFWGLLALFRIRTLVWHGFGSCLRRLRVLRHKRGAMAVLQPGEREGKRERERERERLLSLFVHCRVLCSGHHFEVQRIQL